MRQELRRAPGRLLTIIICVVIAIISFTVGRAVSGDERERQVAVVIARLEKQKARLSADLQRSRSKEAGLVTRNKRLAADLKRTIAAGQAAVIAGRSFQTISTDARFSSCRFKHQVALQREAVRRTVNPMIAGMNGKLAKRAGGGIAGWIPIVGDGFDTAMTSVFVVQDYRQAMQLKSLEGEFKKAESLAARRCSRRTLS